MSEDKTKEIPVEETEKLERKYDVIGQKVQVQAFALVAKCPHVDLVTGDKCKSVLTTAVGKQNPMNNNRGIVDWDFKAVQVFDDGGTIAMHCGECGSLLEIKRGTIRVVKSNAGPNRKQRRMGLVK